MLRLPLVLFCSFVMAACGGDASSSSDGRGRARKDRGEAAMQLGAATWQAESTSAKIENGILTLRATRTDRNDGKVSRQELQLQVRDYKGPGDYTTGMGSRFIGVGIDAAAVQESAESAQGDAEQGAAKVVTDALSAAKHMMLMAAKVTVTSAGDEQISGTFSWQPPKGLDTPAITNGTFRALVRD
jgi:hypothetical protein